MTRLRATFVREYEVTDSEHYGTEDPGEQAAIDEDAFLDDPVSLFALAVDQGDYTVKVEVVTA